MTARPPCYNWKANRLDRRAAKMRARYLFTGSGCAAQRKARDRRIRLKNLELARRVRRKNLDLARCDREIALIQAELRDGYCDVEGLCRGLIDWHCERDMILEELNALEKAA